MSAEKFTVTPLVLVTLSNAAGVDEYHLYFKEENAIRKTLELARRYEFGKPYFGYISPDTFIESWKADPKAFDLLIERIYRHFEGKPNWIRYDRIMPEDVPDLLAKVTGPVYQEGSWCHSFSEGFEYSIDGGKTWQESTAAVISTQDNVITRRKGQTVSLNEELDESKEEKKFLAVWGPGFPNDYKPHIGIYERSFFTEDRSYDKETEEAIDKLQEWEATDKGLDGGQIIIRLPEGFDETEAFPFKPICLQSVGTVLDANTGFCYGMNQDGTIDHNTGVHVDDTENDDWFENLSEAEIKHVEKYKGYQDYLKRKEPKKEISANRDEDWEKITDVADILRIMDPEHVCKNCIAVWQYKHEHPVGLWIQQLRGGDHFVSAGVSSHVGTFAECIRCLNDTYNS